MNNEITIPKSTLYITLFLLLCFAVAILVSVGKIDSRFQAVRDRNVYLIDRISEIQNVLHRECNI